MTRRQAATVFFGCVLTRLCALLVRPPDLTTLHYQLGTAITEQGRAAFASEIGERIEPMYPLLLAAGRLIAGPHPMALLMLQIGVAAAAGVALFDLTRTLTGNPRAAAIASALYAVSPYLVRQSAAFMDVTLGVSLLIAIVWTMTTRSGPRAAAGAGALFAALVLTRMSYFPIAAGGIVLLARASWRSAGIAAVVVAACVSVWIAFARSVGASPFPARVGENLFVSTSEWTRAVVPWTNVDVLRPLADQRARGTLLDYDRANPSAREIDRVLLAYALTYARAHPWDTFVLKARNAGYALQPRLLPFTERRGSAAIVDGTLRIPPQASRPFALEIAAGCFQALLLAGGAAGLWKRRYHLGGADAILVLVAGSILAINIVFFPASRLLAPMTFVLMFYTAACAEPGRGVTRDR